MKKLFAFGLIAALGFGVRAESVTNNLNLNNWIIVNHGYLDLCDSNGVPVTAFTNENVRGVTISVGQMSGVDPETGNLITNAANLLPLKVQSLDVVGAAQFATNVLINGSLEISGGLTSDSFAGDGAGLTNLNAVTTETDPVWAAEKSEYVTTNEWSAEQKELWGTLDGKLNTISLSNHVELAYSTNDMLLYYDFEQDSSSIVDRSGNGNDGIRNGSEWSTSGRFGGALSFSNTTNDYIEVPRSAILEPASFSISVWVYNYGESSGSQQVIMFKKNPYVYDHEGYSLRKKDGSYQIKVTSHNPVQWHIAQTTQPLNTNQWYHLVATFDRNGGSNNLKLYVNGELEGQATHDYDLLYDTNTSVFISRRLYDEPETGFLGKIDELRFFGHALPEDDIRDLYQTGKSLFRVKGDAIIESDLIIEGSLFGDGSGLTNLNAVTTETDPVWSSEKAGYLTVSNAQQIYLSQSGGAITGALVVTDGSNTVFDSSRQTYVFGSPEETVVILANHSSIPAYPLPLWDIYNGRPRYDCNYHTAVFFNGSYWEIDTGEYTNSSSSLYPPYDGWMHNGSNTDLRVIVASKYQLSFGSGYRSHQEGLSEATVDFSHSEGAWTKASGFASHVEGLFSHASSDASHAEGGWSVASGYMTHAEGDTTVASGHAAHSQGTLTIASGDISHAEGDSTVASGTCAHSEGASTLAAGFATHAAGYRAKATNDHAYVWADGQYEDFNSTADHQYSVRAAGGVRMVTSGAGLWVDGQRISPTYVTNHVTTSLTYVPPQGDLSMGEFTNGPQGE